MTSKLDRKALALFAVLSACLLLAATQVSDGFFTIDEVMYFIGADAFARTGSFAIQNGFDQFASDNLRLWLLSDGPLGLTPQYPIGTTLAAAPLMAVFGTKTLIFLNVVAGIATLLVIYALAMRLFGSREVAVLSVLLLGVFSFWPEYVLAHWPHSISILFANLTILFFLIALEEGRRIFPLAALAGVTIGIGMFFRLEVILLLPAFTAIAILFAPRPVVLLIGGVLGFLPMLGLMAVANEIRFGSYMPLSYGSTGGATVASRYIVIGVVLMCALGAMIVVRLRGGLGRRESWIAVAVGFVGLCALALSPYGSALVRLLQGVHALFIDATTVSVARVGIDDMGDGTVLFWGLPKKALAQSMPWLGCLAFLITVSMREHRRSVWIIAIIFAIWSLPFVMRSWHGGLGSNMRYFLPVLPVLLILSSKAIFALFEKANDLSLRLPFVLGITGFAFALGWTTLIEGRTAHLHQIVSLAVCAAVTVCCLLAAFSTKTQTATIALGVTCFALGQSAFLSLDDITSSQLRRSFMADLSTQHASFPGPVLIYGQPESVSEAFRNNDQLVALPHPVNNDVDPELIANACQAGHRVLFPVHMQRLFASAGFKSTALTRETNTQGIDFRQVDCPR